MGKSKNSHIVYGTKGNPQYKLSQWNAEKKVKELAERNKQKPLEEIKFDGTKLSYLKSKDKLENYLLNLEHKKGGPKAKFFIEKLGYTKNNYKQFYEAVKESIDGKTPFKISKTEFGLKYEFHEKIKGVNGKEIEANVIVITQKDNGKRVYRIISAYPGKKEKNK